MGNTARDGQGKDPAAASERSLHKCNFRTAGQLSNEQKRRVTWLHETFARDTMNALGMHLRVPLEMKLASIEQLTFGDFIGGTQDVAYVAPLQLGPRNAPALLRIDSNLVFTMIDLLLGGSGAVAEGRSELTQIDENVMEVLSNVIAHQLENTWQALQIPITLQSCVRAENLHQQFSPLERMLSLCFELHTTNTEGKMQILAPSVVMNLLLRQIAASPKTQKMRAVETPSLRERLIDCEFNASLCLPRLPVQVRDLLALAPGSVLKLRVPVKSPSFLMLEGRETFEAVPVRSGTQRAAQVTKPIAQPAGKEMR